MNHTSLSTSKVPLVYIPVSNSLEEKANVIKWSYLNLVNCCF